MDVCSSRYERGSCMVRCEPGSQREIFFFLEVSWIPIQEASPREGGGGGKGSIWISLAREAGSKNHVFGAREWELFRFGTYPVAGRGLAVCNYSG